MREAQVECFIMVHCGSGSIMIVLSYLINYASPINQVSSVPKQLFRRRQWFMKSFMETTDKLIGFMLCHVLMLSECVNRCFIRDL